MYMYTYVRCEGIECEIVMSGLIMRILTQVTYADPVKTGARGPNGHGYYDYSMNMFVMPDGR